MLGKNSSTGSHWISIADMMSGLMMIFLFIAVSYMINVTREKDKIKEIAVTYNRLQNELYDDLYSEFKDNLTDWNAEIDRQTLSVRFESPDVLFEMGSSVIKPKFQQITCSYLRTEQEVFLNIHFLFSQSSITEIGLESI